MDVYLTEQEQVEQLKKLWKKYGSPLIMATAVVLLASFGWRYWQNQKLNYQEEASIAYEQMLNNVVSDQDKFAMQLASRIREDYSKTPYADLSSLMLARLNVEEKNIKQASEDLTWVMTHGHSNALKQIARIRQARLLIAQQQYQSAVDLLAQEDDPSFKASIEEIKGNAYLAMGQQQQAEKSYSLAIAALPEDSLTRPLIQMKLDDVKMAGNDSITHQA